MTIKGFDETRRVTRRSVVMGAAATVATAGLTAPASAKTAREINADVEEALNDLFGARPDARTLFNNATGVLVIPEILKAGFIVGGAYGEGALIIGGVTDSYWSYGAGSVGLQLGAQKTRQALFFLTPEALNRFRQSDGVEIGADFEATIVDAGAELAIDSNQATSPVIAIVYGRQGLLGGVSLQGGQYQRIVR